MEVHLLHRAQHQLQRDWHPNPTRPLLASGQEVKCGNLLQSGPWLASLRPSFGERWEPPATDLWVHVWGPWCLKGLQNTSSGCGVWMLYFIFFPFYCLYFYHTQFQSWGAGGGWACRGYEAVKSHRKRTGLTWEVAMKPSFFIFFSSRRRLYEQSPKVFEKIYTKRPQPDGSQFQNMSMKSTQLSAARRGTQILVWLYS